MTCGMRIYERYGFLIIVQQVIVSSKHNMFTNYLIVIFNGQTTI